MTFDWYHVGFFFAAFASFIAWRSAADARDRAKEDVEYWRLMWRDADQRAHRIVMGISESGGPKDRDPEGPVAA